MQLKFGSNIYVFFVGIRWKVLDSDESIEKLTLFSRLKSGCPVLVTSIEEERESSNASKT